ncbi:MAG TPA: hypothetical protein VN281_02620 [Verrucomicrobiae bacterium]|nr:hypothetical protein [Verrucomicrobiae bacterium]
MKAFEPKTIRARTVKHLALSTICVGVVLAAAAQPVEVPIWTMMTVSDWHTKEANFSYGFRKDKLLSAKSWDYQTEEFPLELGAEAARARSVLLADHPSNVFTLYYITMRRLSTVRDRLDRADDPGDLTNKWFIAFTFFMEPDGPKRSVVALLDGSHGIERATSGPGRARIDMHLDVNPQVNADKRASLDLSDIFTNNYDLTAELSSRAFKVPAVEWNPFAERFPLSLHSQVAAAETLLKNEQRVPDRQLTLIEIYILPFMPVGAIMANNLDPREHRYHWAVVLRFRQNMDNIRDDYYVYNLLDGTILRAVQSAMPGSGVIVVP